MFKFEFLAVELLLLSQAIPKERAILTFIWLSKK